MNYFNDEFQKKQQSGLMVTLSGDFRFKGLDIVRVTLLSVALLISILTLNGCGKSELNEKGLMELLPVELTNYIMNETEYYSEPTELTIDSRNTDGDIEEVDCTVKLEDENFERMESVHLELIHQDQGGWQLSSWSRTMDGAAMAKSGPPEDVCQELLDQYGYQNIELYKEELMDETYYECTYKVNDRYEYVSFKGNLTLMATLDVRSYNSDTAYINWEVEADDSNIETKWEDITGTWIGTSKKKVNIYKGRHGKFELTIIKLKENGWCDGSGWYYEANIDDSMVDSPDDYYYDYEDASYEQSGNCPEDAELTINVIYDYGTNGKMSFTAKDVTMNIDGYWYKDLIRK